MENQDFDYARLADYLKAPSWFDSIAPTDGAKRWWLNANRTELMSMGVLVKHGRRWFVKPADFKKAASEIIGRTTQHDGGQS